MRSWFREVLDFLVCPGFGVSEEEWLRGVLGLFEVSLAGLRGYLRWFWGGGRALWGGLECLRCFRDSQDGIGLVLGGLEGFWGVTGMGHGGIVGGPWGVLGDEPVFGVV